MSNPLVVTPDFVRALTAKDPRIQLYLARDQLSFLQRLPIWDLLSADERLFLRQYSRRQPISVRFDPALSSKDQDAAWERMRELRGRV